LQSDFKLLKILTM